MLRKLLGILLAVSVIFGCVPVLAYTDVASDRADYEAIHRLGDLGIVSGYDDGSFLPQNTITRAEFARLVVSALGKDTEARSMGYNAAFGDVESGLWSAPYINYVTAQGIVSGYADGYFRPEQTISFAESLTILLRVIDYKEDTVGYYWPDNYVDAARTLGISDGLYYENGTAITRGDAAIMIDRMIFTDLCGREDNILLENAGYKVVRDAVVLSGGREVKLSDSNTYTSKMTIEASSGQFADYAVLDKSSNLVALKTTGKGANTSKYSMSVYVNSVADSTVSYVSNGKTGSYRCDSGFTVYNNGVKQTFSQAKASLGAGCDLTFYGERDGVWDFAVISEEELTPVLATHSYADNSNNLEGIAINTAGLTVYRDGKMAALSDIAVNDVVYYNTKSNVMDVYSKKATGIYYEAKPSKSAVEIVTVGGKDYEIGTGGAAAMLGANPNSFEIGDRVTLLLGKNDKAVFAVELSGAGTADYGVVLSTGEQVAQSGINEGSTEIYADIFMTDGETHRIATATDYDHMIGSMVRVDYENTKAKLTKSGTTSGYVGTLDTKNRTLNGKDILKNAVVIQRTAYDDYDYAECELLDLSTMTAKEITDKQLLAVVSAGGFGDISIIYVDNLESTADFGVMSKVEEVTRGEDTSYHYTIYSNGTEKTYSPNFGVSGLKRGTPVLFKITGSDSDTIKKLFKIADGAVADCDGSRIKIGNKVYNLAPDVQVIRLSSLGAVSVDELTNGNISSAAIYSDTSANSACVIRIITVE